MNDPPWDAAMLAANRAQAARLAELEAENARLQVTIVNMRRRLARAKELHANWLLRQAAWRRERDELLHRLSLTTAAVEPSRTTLRRWGPES